MQQPTSKIVERYRKLHALHSGSTTPGEAAAAAGVLAKMRARYPGIDSAAFPSSAPNHAPHPVNSVPYADAFTSGIFDPYGRASSGGWWGKFRQAMDGFSAAEAQILMNEAMEVSARIDRRGGMLAVLRIEPEDVDSLLGAITQGVVDPDAVARTASQILFSRVTQLLTDESE